MNTHISLDFWGTLATANPDFADARNERIAVATGVPVEVVALEYTKLKRTLDQYAEESGPCLSPDRCWRGLMATLGQGCVNPGYIRHHVEILFALNPPSIPEATVEQMNRLAVKGVTFNIASNTNFISGAQIKRVLDTFDIPLLFTLFSDELECSKPARYFFNEIKRRAPGKRLVHIGNDQKCDEKGALDAGLDAILVDSPSQLAQALATI